MDASTHTRSTHKSTHEAIVVHIQMHDAQDKGQRVFVSSHVLQLAGLSEVVAHVTTTACQRIVVHGSGASLLGCNGLGVCPVCVRVCVCVCVRVRVRACVCGCRRACHTCVAFLLPTNAGHSAYSVAWLLLNAWDIRVRQPTSARTPRRRLSACQTTVVAPMAISTHTYTSLVGCCWFCLLYTSPSPRDRG